MSPAFLDESMLVLLSVNSEPIGYHDFYPVLYALPILLILQPSNKISLVLLKYFLTMAIYYLPQGRKLPVIEKHNIN